MQNFALHKGIEGDGVDVGIPYSDSLRHPYHKFLKLDQPRVHPASGRLFVSRHRLEHVFI
jgi:hypothetical protein